MILDTVDWIFIISFFLISLVIGITVARKAGSSTSEYFLSGRSMPWWLLGVSMVATTFSADTPNLVTDLVRQRGVSGNWAWWAFLLTGMLTVFVYARLWRRSGVLTDLEFYELRYSGRTAAFLRGFRALYLGLFFNVMIMATVCLAAIKIGGTLLGLSPWQTLLIASVVTVFYSALGGLKGVLLTDFFQFFMAMIGTVWAAGFILDLPEVGGLQQLLEHEAVIGKLNFIPRVDDTETLIAVFIIPLTVQWWSAWYPGGEPGGGGYIAQRMLSAKNEKHAVGATLFFNVAHYALRPWPWVIIALASIVVFPDLETIQTRFPTIPIEFIGHDLAYPAMLTYLPHGLLGLVIASLIAAFMSTISTHLNWGASYIVNDYYKRFIDPEAKDNTLVRIGRLSTLGLMLLSAVLALFMSNAVQIFEILLSIGAGTGLIFILRWFWWRINAYTELTGMIVSFLVAVYFEFIHVKIGFEAMPGHYTMLWGVGITTFAWLTVTLLTRPTEEGQLISFYEKIKPSGPGWNRIRSKTEMSESTATKEALPLQVLAMTIACFTVYALLFATGSWIYGDFSIAVVLGLSALGGSVILWLLWKKIR